LFWLSDISSFPVVLSIRRPLWLVTADKKIKKRKRAEKFIADCILIMKSAINFAVTRGTGNQRRKVDDKRKN
jgi:hypothetical protein